MSSQPPTASVITRPTGRLGGVGAGVIWAVTRACVVLLALTVENVATGDVNYYWRKIDALLEVGLAHTLNEYPTPVVWMLSIPYGLGAGSWIGYLIAFIGSMLLLDGWFTLRLWRAAGNRWDGAVMFWMGFIFLIGPISYLRFDLVPAVLAGASIMASRRQSWLTGVLTGLGAAIKLWPALLIVPFASHRRGRRGALIGFAVAGFGLALVSLIAGGPQRLISPLTWQSDRGLQIESIWATSLMVLRLIDPDRWTVAISRYQAFELFGPGTGFWLTMSTVATVAGLALIIALFVRTLRLPDPSSATIGLVVLATIAIVIVMNKTLSPQYVVWLGGPTAALLIMRSRDRDGRPSMIARFAVQLLVLALLTHLVYPLTYLGLYGGRHGALFVSSTILLLIRNVGLLVFTIGLGAAAWRATRRPSTHPPAATALR